MTKYTEKAQPRAFSKSWFKNEHCERWLEYSPQSDKVYCLYCYLFAKPQEFGGDAFSSGGYNNWKSMLEKEKGIAKHIGGQNSIHNRAINTAMSLLQKEAHITNVFEKVDLKMKEVNLLRLRLLARISRHLAVQGLAFRGHNEREESLNRGNFLELLVIAAICKANSILCQFFLDVQSIYNIASASCKRRDMLRDKQAKKVEELLSDGWLSTGRGQNQEKNLHALSTTRWNCHLRSIDNLCDMYNSSMEVVEWASSDAIDSEKRAEALSTYERATGFEFALCMFLMKRILSATNSLSECLQRKDQDILNAMRLVRMTKRSIQWLRDEGWQVLKAETVTFCEKNEINIPSFDETWVARGRPRRLPPGFESRTIENHYRIELFNVVVDSTLFELNHRFSEDVCELLNLIHFLDPSDKFASYKFNQNKILELASKYKDDFKDIDRTTLKTELSEFVMFIEDVENAMLFEPVKSDLKELSRVLCKSKLNILFPQLFKLIRLVLTLPISTATTEQAFSAMKILKNRLRTSMGDEFMINLMIVYIEKGIAKSLNIDDIVRSFVASTSRRLPIPN